ncbi:hypothetical protein LPB260_18130 [Pseudomonas sp. LPB0260]|uniref:hypothetical protein n=1 Tax=Pseudomonas sp. LPB0260 TaxID=2614442 RepID=UPI0015C23DBD|nr:hypothetical protein [Pseudomonas sp. LPB0260]QLC72678.1 hypothetical protein LPB260_03180 [Pseudomonas sp. LPB0260]QLC75452.1 hypothetical protein LPB260_18130 [Pseudomonas sp. LPB0260]
MQIGGAMASCSLAVAPLPLLPASPTHFHASSAVHDAPVQSAAPDRGASSFRVLQQRRAQPQDVRSGADLRLYRRQDTSSRSKHFVVPAA